MMRISISPLSPNPIPIPIPTTKTTHCHYSPSPNPNPFLNPKPRNIALHGLFNTKNGVQCNSTSRTPGPGSGENDNRVVLDAFFLGKAFAEALNERIGSTVGEILSVVGQWQADQQKQVQDFQEDVLEKAKRAKEKAALEVMEEKGLISKSSAAPQDAVNGRRRPSSGPTTEDPLQEMLKD